MAERAPEPRGLDQELETNVALECLVASHLLVADDCVRDVGVDVERRGACGPVTRAFVTANRPPRESGTCKAELRRPFPRQVERRVAPT